MAEEVNEKKSVSRSAAYPGFTLEQVVEATKTLRANLGNGPYSRDSAAKALGYSGVSGSSGKKIAACVHFGLLIREGNAYKQSDLANQLFNPQSEEEKSVATKIAFRTPTLYAKLLATFDGRALPAMLDNILVRQHGIQERAATEAAAIFRKSAEYAGVLSNGVLMPDRRGDQPDVRQSFGIESENENSSTPGSVPTNGGEMRERHVNMADSLRVPIAGTEIVVIFPGEYAYELSIGTFSEGIKELTNNVKSLENSNNQPTATPEGLE